MKGMIKKAFAVLLAAAVMAQLCIVAIAADDEGEQAKRIKIKTTEYPYYYQFTDMNNQSFNTIMPETPVTMAADEEIGYLYLRFRDDAFPWTIEYNGVSEEHGQYGFAHELVRLPEGVTEFTMTFHCPNWQSIYEVEAYSHGTLPDGLQDWLPPCEKADLLVLPTHSDDEFVFLGGVIPKYIDIGYTVQVAYLVNHRVDERLDSLWEAGVRNYPAVSEKYDLYPGNVDEARGYFDTDYTQNYLTYWIRKVQPSVIVGQGITGDSGHPVHIFYVDCLINAVELAADENYKPDNCKGLSAWDTPKTYLHQYGENHTVLDYETPLAAFGGRTAFQVALDSFAKCVTQIQAGRYTVYGFDSVYDTHRFGLFRSLVGEDFVREDLFEHIEAVPAA